MTERIFNFSAGPSALPLEVMKKAQSEFLNYQGTGMSIMEMSHRSKEFEAVRDNAVRGVRKHLNVGDDYSVLFLQGGASTQFAMVPMNLASKEQTIDLIDTGVWTQKAKLEIEKFAKLHIVATTEAENFARLPQPSEMKFSENAAYVHLCSNNTVVGTQFKKFPDTGKVPLVADMSSDILSRPLDVSRFGLIFAGAQKNIGPSGVALVIVRNDLAEKASKDLPIMFQYRTHIKNDSMYNTPATFGIYMISLVMDWLEEKGGVQAIEKANQQKADLLYGAIEESDFYYTPVAAGDRSVMNVVFRIQGNNEDLEKRFVTEAEALGLSGLKGHRLVGGLRASIYNAITLEAVQALVDFMKAFERKNK